ncbi:hypothetical protein [Microbulbifer sediminum]|uniref:hypothetical protein n=1 Tax=Microbulbifer sediminum TaxID=2904250 RepID=UPI001F1A7479|nr:hypothetical protein [Microbulbifer sediminum]
MMDSPLVAGLAAGFCILAGVACLYAAWRRRASLRSVALAGWALLGLSVWCWSTAFSLELGLCFSVILTALVAWTVVAGGGTLPRRQDLETGLPSRKTRVRVGADGRQRLRRMVRFFAATFLPAVTAVGAALQYFGWSHAEESTRLAIAVFIGLLAWKLAVIWVMADRKLVRVVLGLLLVNATSGLLLTLQ